LISMPSFVAATETYYRRAVEITRNPNPQAGFVLLVRFFDQHRGGGYADVFDDDFLPALHIEILSQKEYHQRDYRQHTEKQRDGCPRSPVYARYVVPKRSHHIFSSANQKNSSKAQNARPSEIKAETADTYHKISHPGGL